MATDTLQDRYQAIGSTGTADALSSSPIGTTPAPPADQLLVYMPLAGGTPAPPP